MRLRRDTRNRAVNDVGALVGDRSITRRAADALAGPVDDPLHRGWRRPVLHP
jgi:hypothetical protein